MNIRKIVPRSIRNLFHIFYAWRGALKYKHPSEELFTIGVTGTSGKSTTIYLLRQILEKAGYTVGYLSTIDFYVAGRQMENDARMTMLGKMRTQKFLRQMVDEGCDVAIVEATSEGYLQHRHRFINFDVALLTNLYPEHIESHGGFENYKKAKLAIFRYISRGKRKYRLKKYQKITLCNLVDNPEEACAVVPKICIVNLNNEHAKDFLQFDFDEKRLFGRQDQTAYIKKKEIKNYSAVVLGKEVEVSEDGLRVSVEGEQLYSRMYGEHNIMNILAAVTVARSMDIEWVDIQNAAAGFVNVPGRIEFIKEAEAYDFQVMVDYAFEPAGIKTLYKVIDTIEHKKIIQVCGSAAGGRDKARRPLIGKLVGANAHYFVVTNEDPFDENPMDVINAVSEGAVEAGMVLGKNLFKIEDRKKAIEKAIQLARPGDLVLVTGKGNEQRMFMSGGKTIAWDDREVVRETLRRKT